MSDTSSTTMTLNDSEIIDDRKESEILEQSLPLLSDKDEKEFQKLLRKEELRQLKKLKEEQTIQKNREKALKGMKYLLGLSEKYSTFFQEKVFSTDTRIKALRKKNNFQPTLDDLKNLEIKKNGEKENGVIRRSGNNTEGGRKSINVSKCLKYFEGGTLKPYQVDGVTWMTVLYENGLNGILADEMGLGKTIQVIALICYLLEKKVSGPFLIVAPLSTLSNWRSEFERFAPQVPVVLFQGSKHERAAMHREVKRKQLIEGFKTLPVVLASYQTPLFEENFMRLIEWQYIVVDEGHRLKNHESRLSRVLRTFPSSNRLILTGTPLQNNITELWALLNFLLPEIFADMNTFASLLMLEDMQDENKLLEQEEKNNLISTIHKVLAPFMLRRLKKDVLTNLVPKKEVTVYCPLSKLQKDLYSYVISKNFEMLLKAEAGEEEDIVDEPKKKRKCVLKCKGYTEALSDDEFEEASDLIAEKFDKTRKPYITRLTMNNPVMMFKKIVDHPYLIHFPLDPTSEQNMLLVDENLIEASGKMMVLDAMLPHLKKNGHKVLIFSTLVIMLDFIEDFMIFRGHSYRRLDGGHSLDQRATNILEFNTDPDVFAFLISTRAGGQGLNLTGADTVIFFDRDWNPQVDIQAQDRCHRIGQTRPVVVYTLITKNTIDEKIISRGHKKRVLEKLVIKDGKFRMNQHDRFLLEDELQELQKLLEKENTNADGYVFSKEELNKLLDRSELYDMLEKENIKQKDE